MEAMVWLILLAVFLVIEAVTLGLTTIWFAGGALVAFIAAMCGAGMAIQIVLFVVVSVALLVFTRPMAVKYMNKKTERTNVDSLIGKHAVVTNTIDNLQSTGQVQVNGLEWTARASQEAQIIPKETVVEIIEVDGVKLIVKPVEED